MIIEHAKKVDSQIIFDLIFMKSEFDRSMGGFNEQITTSIAKIEQTLFGLHPFAKAIIAKLNSKPVGFALYHYRYSSFSGSPSIWLDDLYVVDEYRSSGIGSKLMESLKEAAIAINCSHISWTASPNNVRGQQFYERLGAEIERMEGSRPIYKLPLKSG